MEGTLILLDSVYAHVYICDCLRCAQRLAEMTNVLLKVAPYDKETMSCAGLRCYLLDILPIIDWTQESVRPALNLLLKRMEKVFTKLYKKPSLRVNCCSE